MGRKSKPIYAICAEYGEEFLVYNEFLLMCKSCKLLVPVKKRARIADHLQTRVHLERKAVRMAEVSKEQQHSTSKQRVVDHPNASGQDHDLEEVS